MSGSLELFAHGYIALHCVAAEGAIRVFSFAALWRWSFVGLLFAAKSVLLTMSVESGLHHMLLDSMWESV